MLNTITTAGKSATNFMGLIVKGRLKLKRQRLGSLYAVEGEKYKIFRETENPSTSGEAVTLVIGFRLKIIRSNRLMHWLFQRVCIITTPFWSGLAGFKTKLWMVDPNTKNYLGIYDWRGKRAASQYIEFLLPILKFFSVKDSVWAKQLHGQDFEDYLTEHIDLIGRRTMAAIVR